MKKLLIQQLPVLLFFFFSAELFAQGRISSDKALQKNLHQAIDHIYGLEFEEAALDIIKIEKQLGRHPAVSLIKAFDFYWKKKPFKMGTHDFLTFEGYLQDALQLSANLIKQDENDLEAKFFALSAHAYLAELYVENNEKLKALGEAKSCYSYILEGFDVVEDYPEYYFPCGIYNYYRVKYPEENPFYKTFVWFFRSGDKDEGIKMLKKGAEKAIFTKVESLSYLFHIYLRYEYQPRRAMPYTKKLYQMYPANLTFVSNYIENLLLLQDYKLAKPLIDTLLASSSKFENYKGNIFYGMYLEKSDTEAAIKAYVQADKQGGQIEMRSAHFDSYLYIGLGRTYLMRGDREKAKYYFKLAQKRAEYSFVENEATEYLNKL